MIIGNNYVYKVNNTLKYYDYATPNIESNHDISSYKYRIIIC